MKTLIKFIKNLKSFYQFYKDYEYNGDACRIIIESYQEVLCSRTKTMSKPVYCAKSVIAEMDKWYEDSWKSMYKCNPIEVEKPKIMITSDGKFAQVYIDGKKVRCTDMELRFIGHVNEKPMITVDAQWNKTDENGNVILNEDKTEVLTEGIKINC
jgi:hypothetical protein